MDRVIPGTTSGVRMRVVDSHTEGEPTRVVVDGGPDLGAGSLKERLIRFRETADHYRRMAILEPRGSEAIVGALLCEPEDRSCAAGVLFFNNAGYLGMCGHGAIGVAVTLASLGRIGVGNHRLETPVGVVQVELLDRNTVAIDNVRSFRHRADVSVDVPGVGTVVGDIAWGGNWFFLAKETPVPVRMENLRALTASAERVMTALKEQRIFGADGGVIDHVEFFDAPAAKDADSRNFVLCPGGAYDRSPCGTGTSAKLACLAADGKLQPGEPWVQESLIGSRFHASYRAGEGGGILPRIVGRAFLCGESTLFQQPEDPFAFGIELR